MHCRHLKVLFAAFAGVAFVGGTPGRAEISPFLVGNNVWYNSPPQPIWDLTRKAGVKLLRIGGHSYDRSLPDNATLVKWVKQIRAIGAEPLLQVSQYKPAGRAAELVRLFNVDKAAGEPIRYWSIGNEPWLQNKKPDFAKVAPMVEAYTLPIAAAMKEVDATIKIFGPDECDFFDVPMNDLFGGKHNIAGKVPGKDYYYIDGLTWHRYPQVDRAPGLAAMKEFEERSKKSRELVDRVNRQLNRTGDDALMWAITEFNAKNGPFVHTWGNGQFFGAVYGYAMKYDAFTAATWSMSEHNGDRKGTDYSFIDGANKAPRASYWHMQLVSKYFTGDYIDGAASSENVLVYAARDGDRLSVMILNTGNEAVDYRLAAKGAASASSPTVSLALDIPLKQTVAGSIDKRTTQVLLIEKGVVRQIVYGEDDFLNERSPSEPVVIR